MIWPPYAASTFVINVIILTSNIVSTSTLVILKLLSSGAAMATMNHVLDVQTESVMSV